MHRKPGAAGRDDNPVVCFFYGWDISQILVHYKTESPESVHLDFKEDSCCSVRCFDRSFIQMEYIRVDPEESSFLITTQIIRITQGQSESGHTIQGNHMLVLSRTSSNAETAIAAAEPVTPAQGWWALGGF